MLKLNMKKHHIILSFLIGAFVIAWAVWTFFLLPASEGPLGVPPPPGAEAPTTTN